MPKSRKTVPIDALLEYANGYLASDYPDGDAIDSVNRRKGVIDLLEQALVTADRYRGYSYLDQNGFEYCKPGIRWTVTGGHTFENTDSTRRRYA